MSCEINVYTKMYKAVRTKIISLFKIISMFVKDKIILKRSWSETREQISIHAKEDPVFKIGEAITKTVVRVDESFRKKKNA